MRVRIVLVSSPAKPDAQIMPSEMPCLCFPLGRSYSRSVSPRRWQRWPLVGPGLYSTSSAPPLGRKMSFPIDSAKVPRLTFTGQPIVTYLPWDPKSTVSSAQTTLLEEWLCGGPPKRRDGFTNCLYNPTTEWLYDDSITWRRDARSEKSIALPCSTKEIFVKWVLICEKSLVYYKAWGWC